MKFLFSVMMCSALAASVVMIDLEKCSVDYIRDLVQKSCIRRLRERRHTGEADDIGNIEEPHRFGIGRVDLPHIPHHLLPPNVTLVAMRKQRRISKRAAPANTDIYFKYCCDYAYKCEHLQCPF